VDFHAWCWGANPLGQLGNGTTSDQSTIPVQAGGGLRFRQVDAGFSYTCGVTYPDNRLYCWGFGIFGTLGNGTFVSSPTPVLVVGGLRYRQVSAGGAHTCAITTTGHAFCWGDNTFGALGDSTNVRRRSKPSEVVGGHVFRQIDVGVGHTCAVTTGDRAFCWGYGRGGEIGNGHAYLSFWPRAVSGGLRIRRVSAGGGYTCAETLSSQAYCWGTNSSGQLGDGSPGLTVALKPVAVAGGHTFAQLSAGVGHACAKTPAGAGWCWGHDLLGALGDGVLSENVRRTPVRVAAPM
jgi:alpha-tubulin suppressor-like RCC1 family protein